MCQLAREHVQLFADWLNRTKINEVRNGETCVENVAGIVITSFASFTTYNRLLVKLSVGGAGREWLGGGGSRSESRSLLDERDTVHTCQSHFWYNYNTWQHLIWPPVGCTESGTCASSCSASASSSSSPACLPDVTSAGNAHYVLTENRAWTHCHVRRINSNWAGPGLVVLWRAGNGA